MYSTGEKKKGPPRRKIYWKMTVKTVQTVWRRSKGEKGEKGEKRRLMRISWTEKKINSEFFRMATTQRYLLKPF